MRIAICGSLAFAKEMLEVKSKLESEGNIVTLPKNVERYADGTIDVENKWEKVQLDVIKKYFDEIKNSDAILVVNKDKNGIKNYIGGNGLIEIAFAHVNNKKIFLLNPIPEMHYSDEIKSMNPIILNRDLSKINPENPDRKLPGVGVGVIVMKDGKILLGKRINAHGGNTWAFPGGHLEFFEKFEECAKREAMEETGIKIKNAKLLTVTNDILKDDKKHYATVFVTADYAEGEVANREPHKYEEWKWFDKLNIPNPLMLPIQNLIRQFPEVLK